MFEDKSNQQCPNSSNTTNNIIKPTCRSHGTGVRGLENTTKSVQFEGRFGRIFRSLPAALFSHKSLQDLANKMVAEHEDKVTDENERDDEENTNIPAGYTYLGQFIDHDLTFDPASSLQKKNDPDGLVDFRTPRFDLDCIYGRGPDDQPYLYRDNGVYMLLGNPITGSAFDTNARDLPRNAPFQTVDGKIKEPARALIGDPRNDENTIISQLQVTFLKFHNRVADYVKQNPSYGPVTFENIQNLVRWHYQWVVLHDFLPRIIGDDSLKRILPHVDDTTKNKSSFNPNFKIYHWKKEPYIPVEFSVAAYRFGHSMVRPIYRLNSKIDRVSIFPGAGEDPNGGLTGFQELKNNRAIDWTLYFEIEKRPLLGETRIQPSYKIDTSLVNPLGTLPPNIAKSMVSLAERNLRRGLSMGLPSGQAVARNMGLDVIPDNNLRIGKSTEEDFEKNPKITDISPEFKDNAPLWYYILAESQQNFKNNDSNLFLGPVGGRIVGEVFVGLLIGDTHSYLRQQPSWRPIPEFTREGKFGIPELILQAKKNSM